MTEVKVLGLFTPLFTPEILVDFGDFFGCVALRFSRFPCAVVLRVGMCIIRLVFEVWGELGAFVRVDTERG